jgi:protein transport protein SEC23
VPLYIQCESGGSQARFLYALLDPAETHKTTAQPGVGQGGRVGAGVSGEIMYTEDVPLSVFLSHLYKKAVSFEG